MKKIIPVILLVALLSVAALCLAACGNGTESTDGAGGAGGDTGKKMFLVIADGMDAGDIVSVTTVRLDGMDGANLFDVLDAAQIGYTESGGFINTVDGINLGANEYVYLYTSVEKDKDVTQYALTVDWWMGTTLTSSGVGASQMTIEDGCTVLIGKIAW